jgi:hypothetical protein
MLPLYGGPELNWKQARQNLASCAGWSAWESQEQWEQLQWMSYNNRNICILSDSQACIKALGKYQITSKLVWNCHQSLIQVARESSTDMGAWSQGCCWWWNSRSTGKNRIWSSLHSTWTDLCGVSIGVGKKVVRDWTNRNHIEQWQSTIGLKQAKGLTSTMTR